MTRDVLTPAERKLDTRIRNRDSIRKTNDSLTHSFDRLERKIRLNRILLIICGVLATIGAVAKVMLGIA
ncbi:hypothetical protein [Stakelama pacifica]|uniref:Uncharacterized protein n=1 Tax=Stakelama pacifica TaxID=517720 RepID=A0A4R6FE52_9SPHN|nr:hypothetical protein [Stakelama pacifica]TDN79529.1 hypothetical protein EV664_1128 [Stakelama pacifica]GGP00209.1 hypothetical protein GCM10011329_35550 [Stakelama pacifica]